MAAKAGQATANGAASPEDVDLAADRHRGQFALRKLYHESDRLVVVLYTSPSCGPCRTLKPIFSKVADEYTGKVRAPVLVGDGGYGSTGSMLVLMLHFRASAWKSCCTHRWAAACLCQSPLATGWACFFMAR